MRDELGINVIYKWVADGAQAQEKLKLAMASGDLPDVITLEGSQRLVDFQQLAEADLLADMTDLWEQYASPLAKEVVGADGQVIFNAVSHGGRMKGIPGPARRDWIPTATSGYARTGSTTWGWNRRVPPRTCWTDIRRKKQTPLLVIDEDLLRFDDARLHPRRPWTATARTTPSP